MVSRSDAEVVNIIKSFLNMIEKAKIAISIMYGQLEINQKATIKVRKRPGIVNQDLRSIRYVQLMVTTGVCSYVDC